MANPRFRAARTAFHGSLLATSFAFATACATDAHKALFPIEAQAKPMVASPWTLQYQDLQDLLKKDPSLKPYVLDLLEVAQAEAAEEQGQWDKASQHWIAALKIDKGAVGKIAFQRWVAMQPKLDQTNGTNHEALARILLAATKNGEDSPWLKKQGLVSQSALAKRIQSQIGLKVAAAGGPPPPLPAPESFSGDVLFDARVKAVCHRSLDSRWITWASSLSEAQRLYWNAMLAGCEAESGKAALLYKQALGQFSNSKDDQARAVHAAELLVASYKAVGDRVAATEAYQDQANLLRRGDVPLDVLRWTPFEKQRRYIEAIYWVGRNRAMQGDYERAKIATHEGLDAIPALEGMATDKDADTVIDLKIDGYHLLSSRIAYEQQDYNSALALNKIALAIPGISKDWRQRLMWAEVWYNFRKGDRSSTLRALDAYFKEPLEDSSRTKALYWTGRVLWESGEKSAARSKFAELKKLAPLSYYAVVAVPKIDTDARWWDIFKKADAERLNKIDDFEWGEYRDDPEAIRRFHRLEFAVAGRMKPYLEGLGTELFEQVNNKPKLLKDIEPSLYASRLLHMAQQYILAISLSTQISAANPGFWEDYPEQIFIFFPRPYENDVRKFAQAQLIEPELVWGLSRQESSFKASTESGVGAIGLMQLMPATAQETARAQGLPTSGIVERLRQPDYNLQLGTSYLAKLGKRYQNQWPRAIAAYNAGEFVVDTWMVRRDAADPIVWTEALSFGETSTYVKNVWRNWDVYRWLSKQR